MEFDDAVSKIPACDISFEDIFNYTNQILTFEEEPPKGAEEYFPRVEEPVQESLPIAEELLVLAGTFAKQPKSVTKTAMDYYIGQWLILLFIPLLRPLKRIT